MSGADDDGRSETGDNDGQQTPTGTGAEHTEPPEPPDQPGERRRRGLETMAAVYGWDVKDGPGDFFSVTVEHLFAEIWNREGLSFRDRRLLLIGLLVGQGLDDVVPIQLGAALGNGELSAAELREIVIFLTHYAGWPRGAKLDNQVERLLAGR